MTQQTDLIIIGTGVAGLTAAGLAQQAGISTTMIESLFFGGLITNVNELDGPIHGSGSDHAAHLLSNASDLGATYVEATATAIEPAGDNWRITTDAGAWSARAVLIASGARLRRLGIAGEVEFEGRGVSRCADCDGPMFSSQDVAVIGGGDSAVQEAAVLAGFARRVHLLLRGETFRARRHLVDRLRAFENVVVHRRTRVTAIVGDEAVRAVQAIGQEGTSLEISCTGVFPYVGLEPASEFVPEEVARDPEGHLLADKAMRTSARGIFAAGAVRAGYGGLIEDAAADGATAARSAIALLKA